MRRGQFDRSIREGELVETIIPGGMPDFHLPDGTPVFERAAAKRAGIPPIRHAVGDVLIPIGAGALRLT